MARQTKGTLFKAREDKHRRMRLEQERLTEALENACTVEEQDAANEALTTYYEERQADIDKKGQMAEAKREARAAKREAGINTRKRKIEWVDGGREAVPGISKRGKEFFAAAEGNLVKCSREITRWETDSPNSNARGVKRGEILMVISDHYTGNNDKSVVDVMVGPDIVRGVPAAALRPLDG